MELRKLYNIYPSHYELRCVHKLDPDIPDSMLTYKWENEGMKYSLKETSDTVKFEPLTCKKEGKYNCEITLRSDFIKNGEVHCKSDPVDVTLKGKFTASFYSSSYLIIITVGSGLCKV